MRDGNTGGENADKIVNLSLEDKVHFVTDAPASISARKKNELEYKVFANGIFEAKISFQVPTDDEVEASLDSGESLYPTDIFYHLVF